jgi:thiol-disulfide isomerase/thioredoxin
MAVKVTDSTYDNFTESGLSLVDFKAEWCRPCLALSPIIEELSNDYDNVKIGKTAFGTTEFSIIYNGKIYSKGIYTAPGTASTITLLFDGNKLYLPSYSLSPQYNIPSTTEPDGIRLKANGCGPDYFHSASITVDGIRMYEN